MDSNGSLTPLSDAAVPDLQKCFANALRRCEAGKESYGDSSFLKPHQRLITEIQEELEDVCGWSAILWSRLENLRAALSKIPQ